MAPKACSQKPWFAFTWLSRYRQGLSAGGDEDTVEVGNNAQRRRPTFGRWSTLAGDYRRAETGNDLRSRCAPARCGAEYPEGVSEAEYQEAGHQERATPVRARLLQHVEPGLTTNSSEAGGGGKELRDYIRGFSGNVRKITRPLGHRPARSPGSPRQSSCTGCRRFAQCATWTAVHPRHGVRLRDTCRRFLRAPAPRRPTTSRAAR